MQRLTFFIMVFLAGSAVIPSCAGARTWYVKPDGSGDVPTIKAGVDSAQAGDTVLASAGRYSWSNQSTGDEYAMILFYRGVTGFTVRSESGPAATVLDAEGQSRIIYFMGENFVTLDGFTITGGVAPEVGYHCGGGICGHVSEPVIKNCIFKANRAEQGGGMWYGGVSAPRIENCSFIANEADFGGGAFIINSSTRPVFVDCIFDDNTAARYGGAIFAYTITFELDGCAIYRNSAGERGGGICGDGVYASTITHCTISGNSAPEGGGIHVFRDAELSVRNTIISHGGSGGALAAGAGGVFDIGCCDIYGNGGGDSLPAGTIDAGHNIFLDPQFCGAIGSTNYNLQSDSPCLPLNHPGGLFCGRIGARPVMCGTVPTGENSWGRIKRESGN